MKQTRLERWSILLVLLLIFLLIGCDSSTDSRTAGWKNNKNKNRSTNSSNQQRGKLGTVPNPDPGFSSAKYAEEILRQNTASVGEASRREVLKDLSDPAPESLPIAVARQFQATDIYNGVRDLVKTENSAKAVAHGTIDWQAIGRWADEIMADEEVKSDSKDLAASSANGLQARVATSLVKGLPALVELLKYINSEDFSADQDTGETPSSVRKRFAADIKRIRKRFASNECSSYELPQDRAKCYLRRFSEDVWYLLATVRKLDEEYAAALESADHRQIHALRLSALLIHDRLTLIVAGLRELNRTNASLLDGWEVRRAKNADVSSFK